MKEVYRDSTTVILEDARGTVFGIIRDNSRKLYYNVSARKPGEKGNTIATRCTYEKAMEIINTYEN